MKDQKNEKWLDELIAANIDTSEPKFDAENWKKNHPRQFKTIIERSSQTLPERRTGVLRLIFSMRAVQIAAAAVVIVSLGLLIAYPGPGKQQQPPKSPAQMVTAMSLRMAYRQGGMEALEQQCDQAIKKLGPSHANSSLADLLTDLNG